MAPLELMTHRSKPSDWAMGSAKVCRRPVTKMTSMPTSRARRSAAISASATWNWGLSRVPSISTASSRMGKFTIFDFNIPGRRLSGPAVLPNPPDRAGAHAILRIPMGMFSYLFYPWGFLLVALALVHFIRRRPDTYWLYIILFLGPLGAIVYLVVEAVPYFGLLRQAYKYITRLRQVRVLGPTIMDKPTV